MKKILILLLFVLANAMMAKAQSNLYVYAKDGTTEETIALADINKITFEGANLVVTPKVGSQKVIPLTAVKSLQFAPNDATGLMNLQADAVAGPAVTVQSGIVKVSGWDASRRASVYVYGVGGQQLYSQSGWNGSDIDISSLPKGVYIIKIENQSTKIRK